MDDLAVRRMREQTIYAVRSNMRRDDVCSMIVPSDLRLLIGAIDAKDERIAELEAQIAEIHASAKRMTFASEWHVEGVRHGPGVYVLMRVGPVPDDYEPTF